MQIPEADWNLWKICRIHRQESFCCMAKTRMSSTKMLWERWRSLAILIGQISCAEEARFIWVLREFMTNINSSGESGQPWRRPLSAVKKGEGDPFIITEKFVFSTHAMTHSMPIFLRPIFASRILKRPQSTQSKAFFRSTLRMAAFFFNGSKGEKAFLGHRHRVPDVPSF